MSTYNEPKYYNGDIIKDVYELGEYMIVNVVLHPVEGWHYTAVRLSTLSVFEQDLIKYTGRFSVEQKKRIEE